MADWSKEGAVKLVEAFASAVAKGSDPGYAMALVKGMSDELIADADPAERIYQATPERFRINPASVAARERAALQQDRRTVEQSRTTARPSGNRYDAIRESVRANEDDQRKRDERLKTLMERGGTT